MSRHQVPLASSFEVVAAGEKKTREKQMPGFGMSKAMICWIEVRRSLMNSS